MSVMARRIVSISPSATAWRSSSRVMERKVSRPGHCAQRARLDRRRVKALYGRHWSGPMEFTLDTDAGRPAYQQIETQVADAIADGTLGPGDRLPPERELALRLGVSRMTVRQAFDALARRGLVERGVGRGTFVSAPRVDIDRRAHVAGFTEQMESAGLEAAATVLSAEVVGAPAAIARALEHRPRGARRAHPARALGWRHRR